MKVRTGIPEGHPLYVKTNDEGTLIAVSFIDSNGIIHESRTQDTNINTIPYRKDKVINTQDFEFVGAMLNIHSCTLIREALIDAKSLIATYSGDLTKQFKTVEKIDNALEIIYGYMEEDLND